MAQMGRTEEAIQEYQKSVELCLRLETQYPNVPKYQREAAGSHRKLAIHLDNANRMEEAERHAQQASARFVKLVAKSPEHDEWRKGLGDVQCHLGNIYRRLGRYPESKICFENALKVFEKLAAEQAPEEREQAAGRRNDVFETTCSFASLLLIATDPEVHDPDRALELAAKAVEMKPKDNRAWFLLGQAKYRTGDCKGAIEALLKDPEKSRAEKGFHLAMAYWKLGEKEKARQSYNEAVKWMEKDNPEGEELRRFREEAAELLGISGEKEE